MPIDKLDRLRCVDWTELDSVPPWFRKQRRTTVFLKPCETCDVEIRVYNKVDLNRGRYRNCSFCIKKSRVSYFSTHIN